jgi:hypothetical protein
MSENTNLLLIAALGAGGLWLFHDREKHKRAAKEVREELGIAAAPPVRPVSMPAARPEARAQRIKLAPRSYDALFAEYGNGIPVAYLRALAWRESGMSPRDTKGPAWGLMQVIEIVRKDYNERHGTNYERRDLLDPAVNIAIASDVLTRIIDGYTRFHPEATNLQADWSNPLFVELLTFGWNAGFSERAGVGRVANYLTRRGFDDFTIDDVFAAAKQAGVSPHLSNPKKVAFSKGVTVQYLRERARDEADAVTPDPVVAAVAEPLAEPISSPSQVDGTETSS